MTKTKIKLGDKVRCKITGFVGIATGKIEFINGCVQYMVQPEIPEDSKDKTELPESVGIDVQSLEVVKDKKKLKIKKSDDGGPMTRSFICRNC